MCGRRHYRCLCRGLCCRTAFRPSCRIDRCPSWAHQLGRRHPSCLRSPHHRSRRHCRRCLQRHQRRHGRAGPHRRIGRTGCRTQPGKRDGSLRRNRAQELREAAGGNDPAALRDAAVSAVRAALTGDQAQAQDARERATQAWRERRTSRLPEDARSKVAQYEQSSTAGVPTKPSSARLRLLKQRQKSCRGERYWGFALVLGAVAAWLGRTLGNRHSDRDRPRSPQFSSPAAVNARSNPTKKGSITCLRRICEETDPNAKVEISKESYHDRLQQHTFRRRCNARDHQSQVAVSCWSPDPAT